MEEELRFKRAVCARIRAARAAAGLTQEQMAERLDVKPRTYQNYEYERIPWDHLEEIAEATGTDVDYLVTGSDGPAELAEEVAAQRRLLEEIRQLVRELLRPPPGLSPPGEAGPRNGPDPHEPENP